MTLFNPPLATGTLIKRYKRFLADIVLDGEEMTVHCPNTGPMTGCAEPGWTVAVSRSDNPKRKLSHTLEMVHNGETWIGVNTHRANALVEEALNKGVFSELTGYDSVRREVPYGAEKSRVDFLLQHEGRSDCYVEVKSVTLMESGVHQFPDTVTTRGQKHLRELMALPTQGHRSVILYIIEREDGNGTFEPAKKYDPVYAELLKEAQNAGVEVLAYQCVISPEEWLVASQVQVNL